MCTVQTHTHTRASPSPPVHRGLTDIVQGGWMHMRDDRHQAINPQNTSTQTHTHRHSIKRMHTTRIQTSARTRAPVCAFEPTAVAAGVQQQSSRRCAPPCPQTADTEPRPPLQPQQQQQRERPVLMTTTMMMLLLPLLLLSLLWLPLPQTAVEARVRAGPPPAVAAAASSSSSSVIERRGDVGRGGLRYRWMGNGHGGV